MKKKYNMQLNVSIRSSTYGGNGLTVNEDMEIEAETFLEIAEILGHFHRLAEKFKVAKST